MKSVLIIDSYYNFYKIHYAFHRKPLFNKKGEPTSVIHGFLTLLFGLLQSRSYDLIIFASDVKGPTFRHKLDADYKANRPPMPHELKEQIDFLLNLIEDLGFTVLQRAGYEADDVIGTCVNLAREKNYNVEILSADKDIMQFVSDKISLISLDKTTGEYKLSSTEEVEKKFSIKPHEIVDYLALIGDASDNVPGVAGIGPKSASKLINEYHTLEAIYENMDAIKNLSLRKKLLDGKEEAFLSKKLVTVEQFLSEIKLDDCKTAPVDKKIVYEKLASKECVKILERLGLDEVSTNETKEDLLTLLKNSSLRKSSSASTVGSNNKANIAQEKVSKYIREVITNPKRLAEIVAIAKKEKRLAFDLETTSLDPLTTDIVACVLVIPMRDVDKNLSFYLRLKTREVDNFAEYKSSLVDILSDESIIKIGHNLKFEYMVLKQKGIQLDGWWEDTILREYLIDTNRLSYKLESLIRDYFGVEKKTYKELEKDYKNIFDIPASDLESYTFEDGEYTLDIYSAQNKKISQTEVKLYREIEMPLIKVLAAMETRGVVIDEKYLKFLADETHTKFDQVEAEIIELAGEDFNINSTKQLQYILFDKLGIAPIKKIKTGYSTDSSVLEKLSRVHPIAEKLVKHRQLSKLLNTYIEVLPKLVHPLTHRLHTNYSQTVAATGRLSSNHPNLQNIPIKDAEGRKIRRAFIAPPGYKVVSIDYSQVELRILAKMARDQKLLAIYQHDKDIHLQTASLIFGEEENKITADKRNIAKTINFSVMYGISAYALSDELGVSMKEAKMFIDLYFQNYPGVSQYIQTVIKQAEASGYVTTYYGRRRNIDGLHASQKFIRARARRIAFNSVIQGTASDVIKIAMLNIENDTITGSLDVEMVMQVHDELIFYIKESLVNEMIPKIETHLIQVKPFDDILQVNVAIDSHWGK